MRLSGKVSIDGAAMFKVGGCECLWFVSICCLVGGWLLGGIFRAVPDEREKGGGRGRERRYLCVCLYSGEKREERSYRERCKGREFVLPCNVSQQHQLKTTAIYPPKHTYLSI